jgi:hypothetical protein
MSYLRNLVKEGRDKKIGVALGVTPIFTKKENI